MNVLASWGRRGTLAAALHLTATLPLAASAPMTVAGPAQPEVLRGYWPVQIRCVSRVKTSFAGERGTRAKSAIDSRYGRGLDQAIA